MTYKTASMSNSAKYLMSEYDRGSGKHLID
jgi:hypothetical protein